MVHLDSVLKMSYLFVLSFNRGFDSYSERVVEFHHSTHCLEKWAVRGGRKVLTLGTLYLHMRDTACTNIYKKINCFRVQHNY